VKVHWLASAALVVVSAGCRIEQTPEEYIQHRVPLAAEVEATREEIDDRVRAAARALEPGSRSQVVAALAPAGDFVGIGPGSGEERATSEEFVGALERQIGERGRVVVEVVEVRVSPGNTVGWFVSTLRLEEPGGEPAVVRFSGVYLREEGSWRLNQAHVSARATPDPSAPAAADTAVAGV
jgi:hypothetical protein